MRASGPPDADGRGGVCVEDPAAGGGERGDRDQIDPEEVRYVAGLAGLRLSAGVIERLARDMSVILDQFRPLSEPLSSSEESGLMWEPDLSPRIREDEPLSDPLRRPLSSMAPDWRSGFFVVPRLPGMSRRDEGEGR